MGAEAHPGPCLGTKRVQARETVQSRFDFPSLSALGLPFVASFREATPYLVAEVGSSVSHSFADVTNCIR
jgi:hypothetical protein